MRPISIRFNVLLLSFVAMLWACKESSIPADPIEGSWSLYSMSLESDTEIATNNALTNAHPSFYVNHGESRQKQAPNVLTLRSDYTGDFNWDIKSTPIGSIYFEWSRSRAEELTLKPANDGAWVWRISSLTEEFLEVEFHKANNTDLMANGSVNATEIFRLKFKKLE